MPRNKSFFRLLGAFLVSGISVFAAVELDLSRLQVQPHHIGKGGVPVDGIPSIDSPNFWSVEQAEKFLFGGDLVLSVPEGKSARAYPIRILTWHEVVNDEVEGTGIVVTYCPLCASGMVFVRDFEGAEEGRLEFGVSGLLYHSDMVLYDRESMGLWSQLSRKAISGRFAGQELEWVPSAQMTWKAWKNKYPDGRVLSTDTGYDRPYTQSPYDGYDRSPMPMFKVPTARNDLPMKARVVGMVVHGEARAFSAAGLRTGSFSDQIAGETIRITYQRGDRHFTATDSDGNLIPVVWSYWFAWQAFYPETELVKKLR
ncbi:MAG: DUF3179 domain-containing protein [Opitutaceae bacterium]|jgi:hypothetical protein|nr:DUF3179 domain-containing protein [Opitutaceae bacterium]